MNMEMAEQRAQLAEQRARADSEEFRFSCEARMSQTEMNYEHYVEALKVEHSRNAMTMNSEMMSARAELAAIPKPAAALKAEEATQARFRAELQQQAAATFQTDRNAQIMNMEIQVKAEQTEQRAKLHSEELGQQIRDMEAAFHPREAEAAAQLT